MTIPKNIDVKSIELHFNIIQKNHEVYLKKQNAEALKSVLGDRATSPLVNEYLDRIRAYHAGKESQSAMQAAISEPTTAEKLKAGMFATLVGGLVAGGTFVGEQHAGSKDLFGVVTAAQAGFAGVIGASVSALLYAGWSKSAEKPGATQLKKLEEGMQGEGFSKKYNHLAQGIVQLFHFRECLLLDLDEDKHGKMRDLFITHYLKNKEAFDLDAFKVAVELFFLQELEAFFNNAFDEIYTLHEQEMQADREHGAFVSWFKKHFESSRHREQFTQQLQLQFMNQCIGFLDRELEEKGFMGRHPFFMASLSGFIATCVAVSLFAVFLPVLPIVGLIAIGVVIAALAAVGTYMVITKNDNWFFKRDEANRAALKTDIKNVSTRRDKLQRIVARVVQTTAKELADLVKYEKQDKQSLGTFFHFEDQKQVAMGASRAWYREYKKRFIENEIVEDDLKAIIKQIIIDAQSQSLACQKALQDYMAEPEKHGKFLHESAGEAGFKVLDQFIKDTQAYLKSADTLSSRRTFELVQKIKEQILEIVASLPTALNTKPLPDMLVQFYTKSVEDGGLGGLGYELEQVRSFFPAVSEATGVDTHHPYLGLVNTALTINDRLTSSPHAATIFQGHGQYRKLLGLSTYSSQADEAITASNIDEFLLGSFDFLCSLNDYASKTDWDKPLKNTNEFIVYRVLLITQLAALCDPINTRVDDFVQNKIQQFAAQKLNYSPEIAFDDIANQAVLLELEPRKPESLRHIENAIGTACSVADLAHFAEAVRVDMAYVSTSLTRRDLIAFAAADYQKKNGSKRIFSCCEPLDPQNSPAFLATVQATILDTTEFLETIKTQNLLQQTSTIDVYNRIFQDEIKQLEQAIIKSMTRLQSTLSLRSDKLSNLQQAQDELLAFKARVPAIEALDPVVEVPKESVATVAGAVILETPIDAVLHAASPLDHTASPMPVDIPARAHTSAFVPEVIIHSQLCKDAHNTSLPLDFLQDNGWRLDTDAMQALAASLHSSAEPTPAPSLHASVVEADPKHTPSENQVAANDSKLSDMPHAGPAPEITSDTRPEHLGAGRNPSPAISILSLFGDASNSRHKAPDALQVIKDFTDYLDRYIHSEQTQITEESVAGFFAKAIPSNTVGAGHQHSRAVKIAAATALKNAVGEVRRGHPTTWDVHNASLTQQKGHQSETVTMREVCEGDKANRHLKNSVDNFLRKLGKKELDEVFAMQIAPEHGHAAP